MPRLRMPEHVVGLDVDIDMWRSLVHYVWYGLDPGSYGVALLLEDYDLALTRSHETIRIWLREWNSDVTANMILAVQAFPEICRGDAQRIQQWMAHGGLETQPKLWPLFRLAL